MYYVNQDSCKAKKKQVVWDKWVCYLHVAPLMGVITFQLYRISNPKMEEPNVTDPESSHCEFHLCAHT